MKVSLNWIREYVDLPEDITPEQIAFDLTMRTVEVEALENPALLVDGIIAGRVLTVRPHPNADLLRVCQVDIGNEEPSQIVCGGTNLFEGQLVAVAPPGSFVRWHGEGEPVELKATKLRGELSEGMICSSGEINLGDLFPAPEEAIILDLTPDFPKALPGEPLADLLCLDDTIIEIDNKSLTNRPDLWGHYGIAREFAAMYGKTLQTLPELEIPEALPYEVRISDTDRCRRYDAVVFDGVRPDDSPFWLKRAVWSVGMRPINVLVDLTNYVMLATGQPTHAFDRDHVEEGIHVRLAREGELLELLDGHKLELDREDLLICDGKDKPIGLAGVMGGALDSILPETTGMVLEVANFEAIGIRKTAARHQLRTEASTRFEKAIDTRRADLALALMIELMGELQPQALISHAGRQHAKETETVTLPVSLHFLNVRSGRTLSADKVVSTLQPLGFETSFDGQDTLTVKVPVWRSTGDVSIKDDILEEVCRMIGYQHFAFVPPVITLERPVRQLDYESERAIREYLAFHAGLQEIFTYPWADSRFLEAAGEKTEDLLALSTPPSPEQAFLRGSLIPGLMEAAAENSRFYDGFGLFEMAQVFHRGESHPSVPEETLPLQKKKLGMILTGSMPLLLFRRLKGILSELPRYGRTENWSFTREGEKAPWADRQAWLNLVNGRGETVGRMGLLSPRATSSSGIRQLFAAAAEIDADKLLPLPSRHNEFRPLPHFPLVEQDLSVIVDEEVSWADIEKAVASHVRRSEFVEEYRGSQVPEGKKSLMFRFWLASDEKTLTADDIEEMRKRILKKLKHILGAELR